MIKTILVVSDEIPDFEATLVSAIELGRRFAAHVDVLHVHPDPLSLVPFGVDGLSASMIEEMRKAAEMAIEERMSRARALHDRLFTAADVSAGWQAAIGEKSEVASAAARLRDITIIGRPDDVDVASWRATLNGILFNSGRPVLLLPRDPPPLFGNHIAVAWNGSAQAARAVAAALPLLRLASQVTILSAGRVDPHASTSGLLASLARHEVRATATEFEPGHLPIGKALLEQSHHMRANLLVMGAYGHSRLREMILGGATWAVLAAANLPVLMAH